MKQLKILSSGPHQVRLMQHGTGNRYYPAYVVEVSSGHTDDSEREWGMVSEHTSERGAVARFRLVHRVLNALTIPRFCQYIPPENQQAIDLAIDARRSPPKLKVVK